MNLPPATWLAISFAIQEPNQKNAASTRAISLTCHCNNCGIGCQAVEQPERQKPAVANVLPYGDPFSPWCCR
jgi:hypothetical protein